MQHIKELRPDPQNRRKHNPRNIGMLVDALQQVGAARSIVIDEEGEVLAGNGVVEAAAEAGLTKVQVVDTDGSTVIAVRRTGLTPEQKRALAIYDNRVAELAEWDFEQLAADKAAGLNLQPFWSEEEEARLLRGVAKAGLVDPDAIPQERATAIQAGDLFELGGHRLLCGDCTSGEDVGRLFSTTRAGLMNTDPPYGCHAGTVGFTAQRDDIEAIRKDDLEGREMQAFLEKAFRAAIPCLDLHAAWYLWHPMLTQGYFAAAAAAADLIIHRQIIWKKEQFIFGRGDYHWRHELCFYGWRQGYRPDFYGERNQDTVWDVAWGEKRHDVGHPTAKPVELFRRPIQNHCVPKTVIYDPFVGSGSQIIAAEQCGVFCYAVEIEPKYCQLVIDRWEAFTGQKAVKVGEAIRA